MGVLLVVLGLKMTGKAANEANNLNIPKKSYGPKPNLRNPMSFFHNQNSGNNRQNLNTQKILGY